MHQDQPLQPLHRRRIPPRHRRRPGREHRSAGLGPGVQPEPAAAARSGTEQASGGARRHEVPPSAGLRLEDGRFIAVGNQERLGPEAAEISARYGEAKITVPANAASIALVEWLRTREQSSATFGELAEFITDRVPGAGTDVAEAFVAKLCDFGVLAPEPVVDDQTPDALRELDRRLSGHESDPAVAAVKEELDRAREARDRFAEAGPAERVVLLRAGKAACTAALDALGDSDPAPQPVWFEDAVFEPACSSIDDWRPVLEDCRRLLDFLQIFDEQHVFSRVLDHRFTARYGSGGVCESLDELGDLYLPAYDDALQITEGFEHELVEADPVLSRLVPLRAQVVADLAERLLRPAPAPTPPSRWTSSPAWGRSRSSGARPGSPSRRPPTGCSCSRSAATRRPAPC
ncbi:hypothetical protein GCM10029992_17560 [Glycomyces albus]